MRIATLTRISARGRTLTTTTSRSDDAARRLEVLERLLQRLSGEISPTQQEELRGVLAPWLNKEAATLRAAIREELWKH